MMRFSAALLIATAIALHAASAATPVVKDIPFPGGSERTLLLSPGQPKATLILFPGGDGLVRLGPDGSIGAGGNFLVRSRIHWVEQGYAVLLPDVPADSSSLMGRRQGDSYAGAVAALVNYARQVNKAPVWLIGTSQGTNAAVNGASHMTHGEIAGVVLTSSLTRPGKAADLKETVFDANLAAIDVPVLIVSHSDDSCILSPPGDDGRIQAALIASPHVETMMISGGKPAASAACEAQSPHGFYGVEIDAIQRMGAWIAAH
jgi:hypothetical protein